MSCLAPEKLADPIQALSSICPWPEERPALAQHPTAPGWLGSGVREILGRELSAATRLAVELGSWVGLSTRFIADCAPNATVVAVDHWRGSPEHQKDASWRAMLPSLYETFLALCWDYRDRLIPLRMSTLEGLRVIAKHGGRPDLIYIDAEHSYEAVLGEIELIRHLFPSAVIVGDDYDWPGIAAAVADACGRHKLRAEFAGEKKSGRAWKLVPIEGDPFDPQKTDLNGRISRLLEALPSEGLRTIRATVVTPSAAVVDCEAVRAAAHEPHFMTFVRPSVETGIYPFVRIVKELARQRPEIPILVVDDQGTGEGLVACGLDPASIPSVHVMRYDGDSRRHWGVTRLAIFPSLASDLSPAPAVEAMVNGIPVVASDRGSIVDALGRSGVILPLPGGHTTHSRALPTVAEMSRWVKSIIQLWDDPVRYDEHRRLALEEAGRLSAPFEGRARIVCPPAQPHWRAKASALIPYLDRIEPTCDRALGQLEAAGVRVVRRGGCSAIDLARSELASDALHQGAESILFIDSDMAFDPADALRILARPEPVVSGVYAKKKDRELACVFADGIKSVVFGMSAPRSYPLKYAGAAFLRVHSEALRRMIADLRLPLCNTEWGPGVWPFFMPLIVEGQGGGRHYLGEDWAFCHRLRQIGINPLADTSIRLYHLGSHGYGWEEVGSEVYRYRTYTLHL